MNHDVNLMKSIPADSVSGNAISSMGISTPPPLETSPAPASQPSPRVYQERMHVNVNTLPEFTSVSAPYFLTICYCRHLLQAKLQKWLSVVITPADG